MTEETKKKQPPEISPYLFPLILAVLGIWCTYDGWLTSDPEMLEHQTFNRVTGAILVVWSTIDFIRTRRIEKSYSEKEAREEATIRNDSQS